jgi:hypothetical protein
VGALSLTVEAARAGAYRQQPRREGSSREGRSAEGGEGAERGGGGERGGGWREERWGAPWEMHGGAAADGAETERPPPMDGVGALVRDTRETARGGARRSERDTVGDTVGEVVRETHWERLCETQ